jgi:hypothetical protein
VIGTIADRTDAHRLFGPAQPVLEEQRSTRVLFDLREAEIAASTMETFHTAAFPESWGWKRIYKAAVIYSEVTEDERFLETVGVNRGIRIKVFSDMDEAISWLSTV